jgi:hypothetical protein
VAGSASGVPASRGSTRSLASPALDRGQELFRAHAIEPDWLNGAGKVLKSPRILRSKKMLHSGLPRRRPWMKRSAS